MEDKMYLDRDGLNSYDTLIKKYIDKKIEEAVTIYQIEEEKEENSDSSDKD